MRQQFISKTTEELLDMWTRKDVSPEMLLVVKELLLERDIVLPFEQNIVHIPKGRDEKKTSDHDVEILPTENGIVLVIPTKKALKDKFSRVLSFVVVGLGILLVHNAPEEFRTVAVIGYFCLFFGGVIGAILFSDLVGNIKLFLTRDQISTRGVLGSRWHAKDYRLASLHNIRFVPLYEIEEEGDVVCEVGDHALRLCHEIDPANAEILCATLNEIVTWSHALSQPTQMVALMDVHYAVIERVVFGTAPFSTYNPFTLICNPDISALCRPLQRLKVIIIHTATYDFYQVEQFLTYALSYLGQAYLKNTVAVNIYGNIELLHPHLKNNLTNLCHSVSLCEIDGLDASNNTVEE